MTRRFLQLTVIGLIAWVMPANANQIPTASSGGTAAANTTVTKTYPSGLTYTLTLSGASGVPFQFAGQGALNQTGSPATAYYSPGIAVGAGNSSSSIGVYGPCTPSGGVCLDRGTITITFSQPVTDPVLHVSGLGGASGGDNHAPVLRLTSPASGVTLSSQGAPTNMNITATSFTSGTLNGATACNATGTGAGCGSIRVNGTVTSLTFAVDLRASGALASTEFDTFGITVTVDEDFSDAPTTSFNSAQAPTHIVGDLRLGAALDADNVNVTAATASPFPVAAGADNTIGVGDNLTGADEDAITTFPSIHSAVTSYSLVVPISGASKAGIVCGWIDFNRNNAFVATERACSTFASSASSVTLAWNSANGNAPTGMSAGNNYVRLRAGYTTAQIQTTDGKGRADSGEVEDYRLTIAAAVPALSITKASNGPWTVGQTGAAYTLNVSNSGTGATSGTVTVREQLPTGIGIRPATGFTAATGWTCSYSDEAAQNATTIVPNTGMLVTCTSTTAIPAGGTVALTIPVLVTSTSPASVTNHASVGGGGDPFNGGTAPTAGATCTDADHCASVATAVTASPPAPAACAAATAVNLFATAPFQSNFFTDNATETRTATLLATAGGYSVGTGTGGRFVVDMNWRWSPGFPLPSNASTMSLRVNGTDYATMTTQAGYAGYATLVAQNGASLFDGTTTVETNRTSNENFWVTLPASVTTITSVQMVYTGGSTADDFFFSGPALYGCPIPADLSITKTNNQDVYTAGQAMTYTIVVSNLGPGASNNAVFTDPAVTGMTKTGVTCGSPTGGATCPTAANTTVALVQGSGIVIPSLPSGSSVTFQLTATVNAGTTANLTNVANIATPSGQTDPVPGNNTASDTDTSQPNFGTCDARMFMDQVPTTTSTLFDVNYATAPFTLTALGSSTSTTGRNGVGYNVLDNYIYGIRWPTSGSIVELIRVGANGTGQNLGAIAGLPTGTVWNNGVISPAGDYYLKSGLSSTTLYRVNLATLPYTATTITLSQPVQTLDLAWHDGLLYGVDSTSSPSRLVSINPVSGAVTTIGSSTFPLSNALAMWGYNNMLLGSSGGAIYALDPDTGAATLLSVISPSANNGDGANCPTASIQFNADLSVTKTNTPASGPDDLPSDTYVPGEARTYSIVVTNLSGSFGAQNVTVSDPIPAGIDAATVSWSCANTSGGSRCGAASGTGALNDTGLDLPPGAVATYLVTMTVPAGFTGDLTNTVTITPPSTINDTNATNNTATDVDQSAPQLTIRKISVGGVDSFGFTGTNGVVDQTLTTTTAGSPMSGATQALTAAGIATTITESTTPATYQVTDITCTGLGAGGMATPDLANRTVALDAAATATGANIECTFTNTLQQTDIQVVKTASPDPVVSGDVVTYQIVVSNNGPLAVSNVLLTDVAGAGQDCTTPSTTATCSAAGGASCPPTVPVSSLLGAGITIPSLPVGGQVTVGLQCTVTATGVP